MFAQATKPRKLSSTSAAEKVPPGGDVITTSPSQRKRTLAAFYAKNRNVQVGEQDRAWWVIDPRRTRFLWLWDVTGAAALVFTAIATPFEVGFVYKEEEGVEIFVVNAVIDTIFVIDMVLQFFVGYQVSTSDAYMRWEFSPQKIARHYVTSRWFLLDIVSSHRSHPAGYQTAPAAS
jgi:hypothetical protein